MEEIDPDKVAPPEWYEASPGRAEDVAFVFFAGAEGQPAGQPHHQPPLGARRPRHRIGGRVTSTARSTAGRRSSIPPVCSCRSARRSPRAPALALSNRFSAHDIMAVGQALRRQHRLLHRLRVPRSRRCAARPGRTQPSGAPLRGQRHAAPALEAPGRSASGRWACSNSTRRPKATPSWPTCRVRRSVRWAGPFPAAPRWSSPRSTRRAEGCATMPRASASPPGRTRRDSSSPASTASAAPCRAGR